jgi:hypothetical protein
VPKRRRGESKRIIKPHMLGHGRQPFLHLYQHLSHSPTQTTHLAPKNMRDPHQRIIHDTRKMIRRIPIGFQDDEVVSVLVCVDECPWPAMSFWCCGVFRGEGRWGKVGFCGWWCWSRGVGAEYQIRWEVDRFRVRLRGSAAFDCIRAGNAP